MRLRHVVLLSFLLICAFSVAAQEADLAVQKFGPTDAAEDSDVSYSVTVTNVGPDAAADVVLTDPVPAGMSFVSTNQDSGPTFTCDNSVTCSIASLAAGETATFTFVFHIDEPGSYTNSATISTTTFDPNDENNTASTSTTTTTPAADLFVTKTAPSGAAPDTDVTFTITLGNAGPDAATNVTLTDNLPAPLTFVSFTQTSGPTMSCGTSTCTIASFPAGATATFELVGHIPSDTPAGTSIENTVTLESDNDPNDENNTSTTIVTVSAADVRIAKSAPATANSGESVNYQITVTNDGPDTAIDVMVVDPMVCSVANCFIGTLASGASAVINAVVPIPSSATGTWSNTAEVTTSSFDPDESDNSATANITLTQSADVRVDKTGPASVVASTNLTYTITVTNDGPSDAQNVVLTDTLPAGTTFVSSSCGTNPCNIGTLAADASVEITIQVNVAADTAGPLSNSATATSSTADPNLVNNTDTADTTVTPAPVDVSVVKTGDAVAVIGSNVTYTITVANAGPGAAQNVIVTDVVPAGTTFVSASPSCSGTTTVTCNVGTLPANGSTQLSLTLTMPNAPASVANTATVDTTSDDPNATNDSSTFTTTVVLPSADLSITKTADRDFALLGSNVTYTIVVSNAGPGAADDVVVTDTLPAGTTLVSASPGCTGTTTVTCTLGTLAPNASSTVELVVQMPSTPGPVSNTATVGTSSTDPTPTNDASTTVVQAQAQAAGIPSLSPAGLILLALSLASVVLVVLRRAS